MLLGIDSLSVVEQWMHDSPDSNYCRQISESTLLLLFQLCVPTSYKVNCNVSYSICVRAYVNHFYVMFTMVYGALLSLTILKEISTTYFTSLLSILVVIN